LSTEKDRNIDERLGCVPGRSKVNVAEMFRSGWLKLTKVNKIKIWSRICFMSEWYGIRVMWGWEFALLRMKRLDCVSWMMRIGAIVNKTLQGMSVMNMWDLEMDCCEWLSMSLTTSGQKGGECSILIRGARTEVNPKNNI